MGPDGSPMHYRHTSTGVTGKRRRLSSPQPALARAHLLRHHVLCWGSSLGWITPISLPCSPYKTWPGAESPSLGSTEVSISSFCVSRPFCHLVNCSPMHELQI